MPDDKKLIEPLERLIKALNAIMLQDPTKEDIVETMVANARIQKLTMEFAQEKDSWYPVAWCQSLQTITHLHDYIAYIYDDEREVGSAREYNSLVYHMKSIEKTLNSIKADERYISYD
ncbi:MAG: hypothetical protein HAW67_04005 [Endozoicomonadaceae bacterium]|nr:hypothetical protein [Endozoicomonadaceae bacterium]